MHQAGHPSSSLVVSAPVRLRPFLYRPRPDVCGGACGRRVRLRQRSPRRCLFPRRRTASNRPGEGHIKKGTNFERMALKLLFVRPDDIIYTSPQGVVSQRGVVAGPSCLRRPCPSVSLYVCPSPAEPVCLSVCPSRPRFCCCFVSCLCSFCFSFCFSSILLFFFLLVCFGFSLFLFFLL